LLNRDGWFVIRQTGSHLILKHHVKTNQVVVPYHGSKEISKGMKKRIFKDAEIEIKK
jgi:predicted RNA binding protein YcfA (HicA-like mRNA interferase family)